MSGPRPLSDRLRRLGSGRLLLALDYDGTLAPIVSDPAQARPAPEAVALLSKLSRAGLTIAVVSGRDTEFLAGHLPVPGLLLVGNHGLEERVDGRSTLSPEAAAYAGAIDAAAQAVAALPDSTLPGVAVEKKTATVAIHYRQAEDPPSIATRLQPVLASVAKANHLELRSGRLVFELRPPLPVDKGTVLLSLVERLQPKSLLIAGDDRTDLDAFRVAGRIRSRGISVLTVGVRSAEAPAEILTADIVVDGVEGMMVLLKRVLELAG